MIVTYTEKGKEFDFRRVVALPGRIGYGFGLSSNASFTMALWLSVRCLGAFSVCLCISV